MIFFNAISNFRAWVPIGNCFILSKEYPGVEKKKSNANFEKSMNELHLHIERLKALYGQFNYAPLQTALSKTKPYKFVSIIDGRIFSIINFYLSSIFFDCHVDSDCNEDFRSHSIINSTHRFLNFFMTKFSKNDLSENIVVHFRHQFANVHYCWWKQW